MSGKMEKLFRWLEQVQKDRVPDEFDPTFNRVWLSELGVSVTDREVLQELTHHDLNVAEARERGKKIYSLGEILRHPVLKNSSWRNWILMDGIEWCDNMTNKYRIEDIDLVRRTASLILLKKVREEILGTGELILPLSEPFFTTVVVLEVYDSLGRGRSLKEILHSQEGGLITVHGGLLSD